MRHVARRSRVFPWLHYHRLVCPVSHLVFFLGTGLPSVSAHTVYFFFFVTCAMVDFSVLSPSTKFVIPHLPPTDALRRMRNVV